jgi:hypothetical protein
MGERSANLIGPALAALSEEHNARMISLTQFMEDRTAIAILTFSLGIVYCSGVSIGSLDRELVLVVNSGFWPSVYRFVIEQRWELGVTDQMNRTSYNSQFQLAQKCHQTFSLRNSDLKKMYVILK